MPEVVQPKVEAPPKPRPPRSPNAVTYTILRGGTLLDVANLYKVHHHEIVELNPDIAPERPLGPDTTVVVSDASESPSESLGLPHQGSVRGAIPMRDGPGRLITAERWKTWGTRHTVDTLDRLLRRWAQLQPQGPPILVGNLSARSGGALAPHKTHQSGRDVDLSYIASATDRGRPTWQRINASNLDREKTWALLKLLIQESDVEVIFIDRKIQKLLYAHAVRRGTVRSSQLTQWLQVAPGADPKQTLIRHASGHDDHLHVRFACRPEERRCES